MRYYFVRHGHAEDLVDSDFKRELTAEGARRVAASAAVMQRLNIGPATIFSSPRLRSRQTAEIIADALNLPVTLAEEVNFGFDLADIRRLTEPLKADAQVMFVGHNPDMSLVVHELTGVNVAMKKGGLARVDTMSVKARGGELVWLIAPKVFDALYAPGASPDIDALATPPQKLPTSSHPLHDLIQRRWSPVGFDPERGIEREILLSILEAARWSASSANLQPWRFIVASRENRQEFEKILSILKEGNQTWARHAAVLMLAAAHRYPKPDFYHRHASHDLGLAVAQMVMQALEHDIYVHQMAGIYPEKARGIYEIPDEFEPLTAIAFGYRSLQIDHLPEPYQKREAGGRERRALGETVFSGCWGESADFLD